MIKLLLVPLVPVFVLLVKSLIDDYVAARKEKQRDRDSRKTTDK